MPARTLVVVQRVETAVCLTDRARVARVISVHETEYRLTPANIRIG